MSDPAGEAAALVEQIRQKADPDPRYQESMRRVVPTGLVLYGTRVPRLREIARDWQRAHKGIARQEALSLIEVLWEGPSREERLVAIYLLGRFKRWIPGLAWDELDRWRRRVDNWEVSDGLAQWVLAPWIAANPERRLGRLRDLAAGGDLWTRRLALVATVPLNRGPAGSTIPDLTLEMVDRLKGERDPMMTKAISWALRGLVKNHPGRVDAYLEANRDDLPPHAVREVENKLRTGIKSGKTKS